MSTKTNKSVVINSTADVKAQVANELNLPKPNSTITTSSEDTLATLTIKAYATVLRKLDASTVLAFKQALADHVVKQKSAVDKAVWENKFDKNGLPRVSAPNDLYNTVSEAEQLIKLLDNKEYEDRIEVAGNTVRKFIAEACEEINEYKKANSNGTSTPKVSTKKTSAVDSEYASL